jgi:hypothetical protein
MVFYIFADYVLISQNHKGEEEGISDTFIMEYSLLEIKPIDRMIILVYFMFTTLSTVGFGDYNPRADAERVFISVVLLLGVAVFSYFMGNFVDIIDQV